MHKFSLSCIKSWRLKKVSSFIINHNIFFDWKVNQANNFFFCENFYSVGNNLMTNYYFLTTILKPIFCHHAKIYWSAYAF